MTMKAKLEDLLYTARQIENISTHSWSEHDCEEYCVNCGQNRDRMFMQPCKVRKQNAHADLSATSADKVRRVVGSLDRKETK